MAPRWGTKCLRHLIADARRPFATSVSRRLLFPFFVLSLPVAEVCLSVVLFGTTLRVEWASPAGSCGMGA